MKYVTFISNQDLTDSMTQANIKIKINLNIINNYACSMLTLN